MSDNIDARLNKMQELMRNREDKEQFRCPRCLGYIPNDDTPGAYPGALSRTTRGPRDEPIYVCSQCGHDEAMLQFTTGRCQRPSEWPVTRQFSTPSHDEIEEMLDNLRDAD